MPELSNRRILTTISAALARFRLFGLPDQLILSRLGLTVLLIYSLFDAIKINELSFARTHPDFSRCSLKFH